MDGGAVGTTGAHGVEVANSYARRSGDDVLLRIHLPEAQQIERPTLRLRRIGKGPGRVYDQDASFSPAATGVLLTAAVPASALTPGLWQLRLRGSEEDSFRRVRARLLVKPRQPVALLTGPVPDTKMAPPRPRKGLATGHGGKSAMRASGYRARLRGVARRLKPSR